MKKNKLHTVGQIAAIYSGIYVNTSSFQGNRVYYLQVRHWDKERNWLQQIEPELREEEKLSKSYLRHGDILLATKGVDHFAAIYDGRYSPAIASSVFTILRIIDIQVISPSYLQWYLNHPATTGKLIKASKGTSTPHIPREFIEQLTMPVPPIEIQQKIVYAYEQQLKAIRLRKRVTELDETIFIHKLLQIANGTPENDQCG